MKQRAGEEVHKAFLQEMQALENLRVSYTGAYASAGLVREDPEVRRLLEAIALLSAACGDGGDSGGMSDDPKVVEVASILQDDQDFPMSDAEANCAARRIVDNVPSDTLDTMLANPDAELGEVTDPETAMTVLDGIFDCVDIEALMVQSMVEDGTPEDQAQCIAKGFGEDEIRSFMELAAMDDEAVDDAVAFEILARMFELAGECGLDLGG